MAFPGPSNVCRKLWRCPGAASIVCDGTHSAWADPGGTPGSALVAVAGARCRSVRRVTFSMGGGGARGAPNVEGAGAHAGAGRWKQERAGCRTVEAGAYGVPNCGSRSTRGCQTGSWLQRQDVACRANYGGAHRLYMVGVRAKIHGHTHTRLPLRANPQCPHTTHARCPEPQHHRASLAVGVRQPEP